MQRWPTFVSVLALGALVNLAHAADTPPAPPPPPPPAPAAPGEPPPPGTVPIHGPPAPTPEKPGPEKPAPIPAPPAPPAPGAPSPGLVAVPTEFDFGIVAQNESRDAEFTLKNVSTKAIHIHKPLADCGCYAATLDSHDIAPGGEVKVKVRFETKTFAGPLTKKLRILSDDNVRGELVLPLKMNVVAGVVLEPGIVSFGDVLRGEKPSKSLLVKWFKGVGQPFTVTKVEVPQYPDGFDITQEPFEDDRWKGTRVTIAFREAPAMGQLNGTLLVRTDAPGYERLDLPMQAYISGQVWVQEREVNMGWVRQGQQKTRALRVRPLKKGASLGKVSARTRNGRVQVEAIPDVDGRPGEWLLQIRVPAEAAKGKLEDVIEVVTEVPGEETTEIKVHAEILG